MSSYAEFLSLNANSHFPNNIEGYWRPAMMKPEDIEMGREGQMKSWEYPWPVIFSPEGFNKVLFIEKLEAMERSENTSKTLYRGISPHRLLQNQMNGNAEFENGGWRWPQGYKSYIELGVPPSRAFYKFVTGIECESLPKYRYK